MTTSTPTLTAADLHRIYDTHGPAEPSLDGAGYFDWAGRFANLARDGRTTLLALAEGAPPRAAVVPLGQLQAAERVGALRWPIRAARERGAHLLDLAETGETIILTRHDVDLAAVVGLHHLLAADGPAA